MSSLIHDPTDTPPVCPTVDGADMLRDLDAAWAHLTRDERTAILRAVEEARYACGRAERLVSRAADAARLRRAL